MTLLKPYIHQHFAAQVWKLMIDPGNSLLYVETRETANRQVVFSGFDLASGRSTFMEITHPEQWLTGMEGCLNGVLFLHGYQSAQSPVHQGITAVNGLSGDTLWNNYTYAMHHISGSGPVAYNTQIQPPRLLLLDERNGATLRAFNASIDADQDQEISVPHVVTVPDDDMLQHVRGDIVGNVHYIEHNGFRIVSLHTLNNALLSQRLLMMQGANLVYEDLLTDKIQKLQPEAFIMHRNLLIYIKNKTELKVLNL